MNSLTPAQLGYRMPAEWQHHAATWLAWPKDPETWPDRVPQVQEIFLRMIEFLSLHETVNVLVDDDITAQEVRQRCMLSAPDNLRLHCIRTVDSWIRDCGPNFLLGQDRLAYNDWIFNAWGNKYEELKRDDAIPKLLESILQVTRF